jgi:hypothetical protein
LATQNHLVLNEATTAVQIAFPDLCLLVVFNLTPYLVTFLEKLVLSMLLAMSPLAMLSRSPTIVTFTPNWPPDLMARRAP